MTRFVLRNFTRAAVMLLASASLVPAKAATTITKGDHDTSDPFNFILNPGEYFKLEFGVAPLDTASLFNLETGQVISTFYVEVSPGQFDTGTGVDETELSCAIVPGGTCSDGDFGPAAISLSEAGGTTLGSYTFGPAYFDCFAPGEVPVDGAECGRGFEFLPRMLFDATFSGPGRLAPYKLTISTEQLPAIPEPASWALLLLGFGAIGTAARRSPRADLAAASTR